MNHPVRIITFLFFIFTIILACTKSVDFKTEVEFEVTVEHNAKGYIDEDLSTTITVVPEAVLEEFSYSYSYTVSKGEGHFRNRSGDILPQDENLALNPFSASILYVGSGAGEHLVKVIATDNYGFIEEAELNYNINDIPVVWTANAAVVQVEPGNAVAITLVLENGGEGVDVSFESRFSLASGSGTLTALSTIDTGISQEFSSIEPGTYSLSFTPDALGISELVFYLKDSNGQELKTSVKFDVVEDIVDTVAPEISLLGTNPQQLLLNTMYTESGATALDALDGDLTDQIVIDASAVNTTQEGSYEVIYTVSDEEGNTAIVTRTVIVSSSNVNVPVTGINVLPATASIAVGSTQQLTASITPNNATEPGVQWSSNNTAVATVNGNGLVTAVDAGDVTITGASVEDGSIMDTATVTVTVVDTSVPVTAIAVNSSRPNILDNETEQFTAVVSPINVTNTEVTWSSSNTGVATVNASTGFVTAVLAGTANIVATATDGSGVSGFKQITVTATLIPVSTITVTRDRSNILDNETEQFTAVVAPSNATNATVTWSSTNPSVATVDQSTGLVSAVSAGTTNIVAATIDGSNVTGSAGLTVTASPILVTGITVSSVRASIPDDETEQFTAIVVPFNADNATVTWSSSNTGVATVNISTGQVTAIAAGVTNIIATATDGSGETGSKELEVSSPPSTSFDSDTGIYTAPPGSTVTVEMIGEQLEGGGNAALQVHDDNNQQLIALGYTWLVPTGDSYDTIDTDTFTMPANGQVRFNGIHSGNSYSNIKIENNQGGTQTTFMSNSLSIPR